MNSRTLQNALIYSAGVITGIYIKILWLPLLFAVATYLWLQYRDRDQEHRLPSSTD